MMKLEKINKSSDDWKAILEMIVIVCICVILTIGVVYSLGLRNSSLKCVDGVVMYRSGDMWRAERPITACKEVLEEIL